MKNFIHIVMTVTLLNCFSCPTYGITQTHSHNYQSFKLSDIIGNNEKTQVIVSPFIKQKSALRALDFHQNLSLEESVAKFHRLNLPYYVFAEKIDAAVPQNLLSFGVQKIKYRHKFQNHYFCEGETIAFKFPDGKLSIKLNTLKVTDQELPNIYWDHYQDFNSLGLKIHKTTECVYNSNGKLIAAWKLNYKENGFPYEIFVDAQKNILKKKSKFLNINATIDSYERNKIEDEDILTSQTVDVDPDFDGRLRNEFLYSTPFNVEPVTNDDLEYIYDPVNEKSSFEEATAFLHANLHLEYLENNGYDFEGPGPLRIAIHYEPLLPQPGGGKALDKNVVVYTPGSDMPDGRPQISIGDGSGDVFKDLAIDRDIVSHELGHHAVYRSVTVLDSGTPSIVLHEALADYFALDATDNSCLGESICADSPDRPACWIGINSPLYSTQCLRSAETNLKIEEAENLGLGHHNKSQVLSGMLWDLRRSATDTRVPGIPGYGLDPAEIRPIVHSSIDFMTYNSGYRDFIIALMEADKAVNGGSIISANIYQAALNRGLGGYMSGIDCTENECDLDNLPAISSNTPSTTPISTEINSKSNSNKSSCGTVSEAAVGQFNITFLLVFLLPLFISFMKKRED